MSLLRLTSNVFWIAVMILGGEAASAQEYPAKLIRVLTSPPGGGNDFAARLIVKGLTEKTGWQVIIDNRPNIIAAETVSRAAPDGHTLLVAGGVFTTGHLIEKMPYDPIRDFAAITMTHRQPNILVVHPSVPVKSVRELIALAKARPGELNYASSGLGATNHLGAELFNSMAGVRIVRINYKSVGAGVTGVLGGEVHLMFVNLASVSPYLETGRLRPLAITSAQPSPLRPGLPTVAASGLPGFESFLLTGVFAPAGTPAPVVRRLNQEIVRAINVPDVKEKFANIGIETVGSSPQDLTAAMKVEIARMGKVIREAGIRAE